MDVWYNNRIIGSCTIKGGSTKCISGVLVRARVLYFHLILLRIIGLAPIFSWLTRR